MVWFAWADGLDHKAGTLHHGDVVICWQAAITCEHSRVQWDVHTVHEQLDIPLPEAGSPRLPACPVALHHTINTALGICTFCVGLVDYWLMPWLVFHVWLSTLALVRHSAPHIPWRPPGEGWDQGAAAVSGCVTVTLPAPIEAAINHLNYPLPHQISPAIPFYQTKK